MQPRDGTYRQKAPDSFFLLVLFYLKQLVRLFNFQAYARSHSAGKQLLSTTPSPSLPAEIDGGEITRKGSVFKQLEHNLQRNPHALAVTSLHQPAHHLSNVLPAAKRFGWLPLAAADEAAAADKPAADHLTITYAQLHQTALKLVSALQSAGAQPHAKMLMLIPNGGEYAILLWCCILMRITYICIDPDIVNISSYSSLKEIIKTVKPSIVVADGYEQATALDIAFDDLHLASPVRVLLQPSAASRKWGILTDLVTRAPKPDIEAILRAAREETSGGINSLIFTSGTSGTPKGCPLRVASMCHILESQSWLITPENSARALQTIHNSRGIAAFQTLQTWKAGGSCVMISESGNIEQTADALLHHAPTFLAITPAMGAALREPLSFNAGVPTVLSVKTVQVGGDAVTIDGLDDCSKMFPNANVCVNHGMTEGGGSFIWPFSDTEIADIPRFGELCPIGFVAQGTAARIWDPEKQRTCRRGEIGHLHLKGDNLLRRYLGSQSMESFISDDNGRWFVTGDTGMINEDGLVFILGRSAQIIRTENGAVVPVAIEAVIQKLPGLQAYVIPVRNRDNSYSPVAIVQNLDLYTEDEIKSHVVSKLGESYQLAGVFSLKQVGFETFPRNGSGKVSKTQLEEMIRGL
ncbi:hypothetical protein PRZ48_013857 [Zasmidium cellare]|uniref:EF-hand domain-containing protein n=1 Tax=Zasmidium cellare TaxID=395010 RepID=A0ABR0E298_ZASCE|nr:hypothetical protein PRZ48_013857 [Zasmidium cellare]